MFSIKYEWIRQPLFNGHILEVSNLPVRISTSLFCGCLPNSKLVLISHFDTKT